MKYAFSHKKLMAPGPVPMPAYVEETFATCNIHHRSKDFEEILAQALSKLKPVFQTEEHCFVLPATGTGAMEAALVNTLSPGDKVLVVDGGKFGGVWRKLGEAFGLNIHTIKVPWGKPVAVDDVQKVMDRDVKAILVQACETSTGVAHPIQALGQICAQSSALLVVDGITALAAYSVPMDKWGVDILIGGSQKGFMLPTGMAFLSLSQKAQNASRKSSYSKYYWDLAGEKKTNLQGRTRYSTPVQFVLALNQVLDEFLSIGLQSHFDRIQKRAKIFREAVNLPLFCDSPSPSLTCLQVPDGVSALLLKKKMYDEKNISIVAGQDQIKDKVLRVGHMGAMSEQDLVETAQAINSLL